MILALDLGNKYGFAIKQSASIHSGFERLVSKPGINPGKKFHLFDTWLSYDLPKGIKHVYYEDVKRHVSLYNARAYCGYLAILQAWCSRNNIKCEGVGVGQIKKFWTGKGNATKEMMIEGARRRGFDVSDDNHADALALLHCVLQKDAK